MIARMTRKTLVRVAALASALLVACGSPRSSYTLNFPEFKAAMPSNGLRVIVLPDPSTPLVEVDVRYEAGSNEDPPNKAGLAHLVEHMMFQKRVAGLDKPPVFTVLQQMDVFFNAFTQNDDTHYMNLVRKDDLENVLAIEAARMYMGCDSIPEAEFEREREVVRNEYRQNWGAPETQVLWKQIEAAYPEGHPYHRLGIGTDPEIAGMKLEDACQFMKDYYVPSRATLIIAGNVTAEEVTPLVNKYFAGIPKGDPKPRTPVPPIELKQERHEYEMDVDETTVTVLWKLPARFSDDDAAAQTMMGIVSGKVNREGRDWEWATGVEAGPLGGDLAPVFAISVSLRHEGDVGKALDTIFRAAKGAYRGIQQGSWEETKDAVALTKADLVLGLENLATRTILYGDYAQFAPDRGYLAGELRRLDALDLDKWHGYMKHALDPDHAVIVIVRPKKGADSGAAKSNAKYVASGPDQGTKDDLVDPSEAVHPLDVPKGAAPLVPARRFTLGNGMKVILQPTQSGLPIMDIELRFAVGSAHESPKQRGMAELAARMLNPPMGDASVGGDASFGFALDQVGAERFARTDADSTTFHVRGLNIYDTVLVKGLERWIKVGDYNQEQIETRRKLLRFAMQRRAFRSNYNFQRAFVEALYGADHPYAATGQATPESLGHIGRDSAFDFKSEHYSARNATLIVAGNFDPDRVEGAIRSNFGDWGGGHEDKPVGATVPARTGAVNVGIENEETPSVRVSIGFPAPAGLDGQYGARMILGEMLSQRMAVIREELGASYGVYGAYRERKGPGIYTVGGQLDGERAGEALARMRKEIDALRKGDGFELTFAIARRKVLRNLITQSGTASDTASRLLTIATFGLADNFYEKLIHQVAAASPEQIKELIDSELKPELEVVAVMGTRAQVDAAFAGAGLTMSKWVGLDDEQKDKK
jgi:zinc protease